MVMTSLNMLYDEYVKLWEEEGIASGSGEVDDGGIDNINPSNEISGEVGREINGADEFMSFVRDKQAIPPMKSELDVYLEENVHIPDKSTNSFNALEWWKSNSLKYKILSKMAADILVIPISTVASESTFSAGGRIIDEYRSRLNEASITALICGGDWLRSKYNLKKKPWYLSLKKRRRSF